MTMSFVTDEFSPSFSSSRVIRTCSASSTNAEIPRAPGASGPCRAKSKNVDACAPFVIHCFAPVIRQPSPTASARVRSAPASDPASGSVRRERPETLAARERRNEARALLIRAEGQQRQRASARVDGDGDTDTGIGPRGLLEHEHVRDEVGAGAAVLLRHAHAHQPELGELRVEIVRETVLAIPVRGVRLDLRLREILVGARISRCSGVSSNSIARTIVGAIACAPCSSSPCSPSPAAAARRRPPRASSAPGPRPSAATPPRPHLFAHDATVVATVRYASCARTTRHGAGTRDCVGAEDSCRCRRSARPCARCSCSASDRVRLHRPGRAGAHAVPRAGREDRALAPTGAGATARRRIRVARRRGTRGGSRGASPPSRGTR